MKLFIGVDCGENVKVGFIGSQGILKSLSTILLSSPLERPDRLGQVLVGSIRGVRGEVNVRMKDFHGMGIGVPRRYVTKGTLHAITEQMKRLADIPVYLEDRDLLAEKGESWLKEVVNIIGDPLKDMQSIDLRVIYGAAKLAMDHLLRRDS